jgi:hypothetical protein
MCRVHNDDLTAAEIADLLGVPAPTLEDLFADPDVRKRIGEWISQAMARPRRRSRWRNVPTGVTRRS